MRAPDPKTRLASIAVPESSSSRDAATSTRDARAPQILVLAALLLLAAFSPSRAAEADTYSPVVSYQYLDTLTEPGTTISSPVVSYQYFDLLGDENVTFQSSAKVSYYFGGGVVLGFTGNVRTTEGVPLAGATITLKRSGIVFWSGITDGNGVFSAPQLPAANYTITVTKAGFQTLTDNIAGYHGGSGTLDVTLVPSVAPLATQLVVRNPTQEALAWADAPSSGDDDSPVLKVFNGNEFVRWDPGDVSPDPPLYPDRMTVVMTHGMLSDPSKWAANLAQLVNANHLDSLPPNIVTWDWHRPANRVVPPIDAACDQGEFLWDGRSILG